MQLVQVYIDNWLLYYEQTNHFVIDFVHIHVKSKQNITTPIGYFIIFVCMTDTIPLKFLEPKYLID